MLRYNEIIENENLYTVQDLVELSGYDYSFVSKFVSGVYDNDKCRFSDLCKANSKTVGKSHKKYYNIKVLEAIKAYQLKAHGNMKNADVANKSTASMIQNATQMVSFKTLMESGNIEAVKEYMDICIAYTENVSKNKQLEAQLEEQRPMVDFYTAVTGSEDTIGIGEVAKILNVKGIGRNTLFEILRNKGVLQSNNIPYQRYVDRGYFRVIESKYTLPNGDVKVSLRTVVYQTGLNFIRNLLKTDKKVDYLVEKSVDR